MTEKKTNWLKRILLILLALVLVVIIAFFALFQGEIRTIWTIEQVEDLPLFTMEYEGDYGFDEFLETGASTDTELISFISSRLLKGIPMEFDLPDLGCSTFQVESPEGDWIFGRNFDMYDSPALLVRTTPSDGYDSISMVNLAYIGYSAENLPDSFASSIMALAAPYVPLDGVNEAGVAVGVLLIDTEPTNQQTDKVDITTTTAIRMILDYAGSVDEALELLSQYDMHASANSCYHFQIADATGRAVVVEYIGDEMNVVESSRATNFLLTEGDWDFGSGQDRFAILESAMEENQGVMTEEEAMELLSAVSQDGEDSSTQWSCVYNQTDGTLTVAIDMDYDNTYSFAIH